MGLPVVALLAGLAAVGPADSLPTYADAATRRLIERAIPRHAQQDSLVVDYRARLRYRLQFSLGRRRWARLPVAAVEEQEAWVQWQAPNDLRVDVIGRRAKARREDWNIASSFDEPWFVPRGLTDSVRIFGSDFPDRAALHPLAADGPEWYAYALTDSVSLVTPSGRALRLLRVEVVPNRVGPALVAGRLWLDAESAEVVRFTFRYVGTQLWATPDGNTAKDSASSRRLNGLINRILTVDSDLEYGLQEGRYWMPRRQVLSGTVQIPIVSDVVIPFQVITTFDDYEINTGRSIVFSVPVPSVGESDSAWRARRDSVRTTDRGRASGDSVGRDVAGRWGEGRYQVHRASADSLRAYVGWNEPLELDLSPQEELGIHQVEDELARLAEGLPDDLTGRRRRFLALARVADAFRYNRVQGLSFGLGYRWQPTIPFVYAQATARYGLSDDRLNGRLSLVREAPSGRWSLSGYHDLSEVDPNYRVGSVGNSVNALFAAHDNADYLLATGAAAEYETSVARGLDLRAGLKWERQRSVAAEARSAVNDGLGGSGLFPANPAVREGDFVGLGFGLRGVSGAATWTLELNGLTGAGVTAGRVATTWRQPVAVAAGVTVTGHAGIATSPTLPQLAFRAGGLPTVRGFDYGTQRGQALWALQTDWALRRGWARPVVFLDAGQAGPLRQLADRRVLVGAGLGYSILRGAVRFDLSYPLHGVAERAVRFDIVFGAPR